MVAVTIGAARFCLLLRLGASEPRHRVKAVARAVGLAVAFPLGQYLGARSVREGRKEVVALPICRRSDWPRNKTTTAVRADISQNVVDTRRAKWALVGANARFKRLGWQYFIAVLAYG